MTPIFVLSFLFIVIVVITVAIVIAIKSSTKEPRKRDLNNKAFDDNTYYSDYDQSSDYQKRYQNQRSVRYCKFCGTKVEPQQVVCLQCGASVRDDIITNMSNKRLISGLLGIFVGVFGVHNFYLGNTEKAIAQLLLGTVGILVIVGPIISSVWGLIEGILILTGNIPVED